ncbi:MAG TPA: DUF1080 domain-containing protein [Verrucomicrobiae bacterium]|nr:DUF1080 domain-containing protein [Verrucomicrobiae bacterium]
MSPLPTVLRHVSIITAAAIFAIISAPAVSAADPEPQKPAGKTELFNGKDYSGWTFAFRTNADPKGTWGITNGVLHCNGQPYGYIRTETPYRDYKLTVEWRFVKVAPRADNTGILLHVQAPDQVWPRAIECQGQSRHHGDLILMGNTTCKVNDENKTGRVAMKGEPNEKPVGQWNSYEIVCSGNTLKASVNGKLLNEVTDCSVTSGFIAIQSEGSEFEVRKVTIEPATGI